MLENPYYHTEEAKQQRCYWRRVGLLIFGAILFAGAIVLLLYPKKAHAETKMKAEAGGVVVLAYDSKCKLKEVGNLPYRATWTENGKTLEGCVGIFTQMGICLFYFEDKTVVAIPMQMFSRVVEA